MDATEYFKMVRELSGSFAETAADNLDTEIAHLDNWKVADLVAHLGGVYAYATRNAQAESTEPTPPQPKSQPPEGGDLMDWFAKRREVLLKTLDETPLDQACWTHAGMQTAEWWRRRMTHESTIHLWDLRAGIGEPQPIESDRATDGVNEFLHMNKAVNAIRQRHVYPAGSLHLHRTDGPGEWMVQRGSSETELSITTEHGKGDAAVRGPASELQLWVWGRPVTDIEIFGDSAVAEAWRNLAP